MTTATATRTDASARLQELHDAHAQAHDEAARLGREAFEARTRLLGRLDTPGLLADRSKLQQRHPELYHPDGSPRRKDSEAGRLQAAIDATPDLAELEQKVAYARQVEGKAQEAVDQHIAAHYPELVEARRPEAETVAAEANARAKDAAQALRTYIAFAQGSVGLTAPVHGIDGRAVPGIEEASNFLRALEAIHLPDPIQERQGNEDE